MIFFNPAKVTVKCMKLNPDTTKPRYNEFPVITNRIRKPKRKVYSDIKNVIVRLKFNEKRSTETEILLKLDYTFHCE